MPYIKSEKRLEYDKIVNNLIDLCVSPFKVSRHNKSIDVEVENAVNLLNKYTIVANYTDSWKGELNYLISKFIHELIRVNGLRYHVLNDIIGMLVGCQSNLGALYWRVPNGWKNVFILFITRLIRNIIPQGDLLTVSNELRGVLECVKLEMYRTVAANYEDKKRWENGSVSKIDDISRDRMR